MALDHAAIRTAIVEVAEGTKTSIRDLDCEVFRFGAFEGQPDAQQIAKLVQSHRARHWFNVTVGKTRSHASTSASNKGNRRLALFDVRIDIWTHTATVAQEERRKQILDQITEDCELLCQALAYPHNLDATTDGDATGISGGLLEGPGFNGDPEFTLVSEDWKRQIIRSRIDATAHVQIAQAVA